MRCNDEFSKSDEHTIPLSSHLALRIYSETKPHNWQIADLQKGLILAYKGMEMVGEGTGFGVPVLICSDETYFSGSAQLYLSRQDDPKIIRKEFFMDTVQRKKIGKVNLENQKVRAISRYQAGLYQKHRHLRLLMPLIMESLSARIDVRNSFVKTASVGRVIVTYGTNQSGIRVKTDFSLMKRKKLQKILMLNLRVWLVMQKKS